MMIYLNESFGSKVKRTAKDVANKIGKGFMTTVNWVKDNTEAAGIILTASTLVIGTGCKIIKHHIHQSNLQKERDLKDRYIYDRSLGMYLHTKRPLTSKDYVTINQMRGNGEKLSSILQKMNILD